MFDAQNRQNSVQNRLNSAYCTCTESYVSKEAGHSIFFTYNPALLTALSSHIVMFRATRQWLEKGGPSYLEARNSESLLLVPL